MASNEKSQPKPKLAELQANTRGAPSGYNLSVKGTPGPDYLGQETVDVDGHPSDRPGVRSRMPENDPDDPRIKRMDTGEELPVLLSSSMRADPVEGTQGTYTKIVEGHCPRCGYDRLRVAVHTLAGEHQETCNACGANIGSHYDGGYRMPETEEDRADAERDAGQRLGALTTRDVLDMEPDTGYGPYISLVSDSGLTRLRKDDVEDLFWLLVENGDIDLHESIIGNMRPVPKNALAAGLLPEYIEVTVNRDDDTDE